MTAEERLLAPWFAAARAEAADPPLTLLSAILADAAEIRSEIRGEIGGEIGSDTGGEIGAAREPAAAPAAVLAAPARPRRRWLQGVGGWKGMTALAACAAVGFWIGLAGRVTIEDGAVWAGTRAVAADADSAPDDPVVAFFDLASVEG